VTTTPDIKHPGFLFDLNITMKIRCQTLFDCSPTGVTGHFRPGQIPFNDDTGKTITDLNQWSFARNQQRNLETIVQMISLRAQPEITEKPCAVDSTWEFVFEVESAGVYSLTGELDDLSALADECSGIPMILNLGETLVTEPYLITNGPNCNIWFNTINI
jgi:hypothetical protein